MKKHAKKIYFAFFIVCFAANIVGYIVKEDMTNFNSSMAVIFSFAILNKLYSMENTGKDKNYHILGAISEICVSESKAHISSETAIQKIRDCLRQI